MLDSKEERFSLHSNEVSLARLEIEIQSLPQFGSLRGTCTKRMGSCNETKSDISIALDVKGVPECKYLLRSIKDISSIEIMFVPDGIGLPE
jgi:hypothetical protein